MISEMDNAIRRMEERLEARLRAIRTIRGFLREDPGFAADLRHTLAEEPRASAEQAPPATSGGAPQGKHIDRVRSFFASNGNKWTTAPDIGRAVGISRGSVAGILYQTYEDNFEHKSHPDHARMKLWRLRQTPGEPGETKGGEA